MSKNIKIVFFGAGAIGQSVGGWIAPHHKNVFFLDRGEVADTLKQKGITLFEQNKRDEEYRIKAQVLDNIEDMKDADVILIGVKNYSLDAVAKQIKEKVGDKAVIIGMQNGFENQKILSKYFSKVIYCVIGYNAWIEEPGVVGYQKKGPLIFGTVKNELAEEMNEVAALFNKGVETVVVDHLQDAVHSKIVINLTNSLTTLIGHGFKEVSNYNLFQNLLSNLLYEGTQIVKAAGYKECSIGGMPPWSKIKMAATLPQWITKGMFKKNAKKMVMSSMAQDIIQRQGHDSELDTINGYIVELADRHSIDAPYNRVIYKMCKREFSKPQFSPLDVADVWKEVSGHLKN